MATYINIRRTTSNLLSVGGVAISNSALGTQIDLDDAAVKSDMLKNIGSYETVTIQNPTYATYLDLSTTAVGNGVIDDTTTITAAVATAAASGQTLVSPAGKTYLVSSVIALPAGLKMDLSGSTVKKAAAHTGFVFTVGSAGCDLRRFAIDGNRSGGATSGGIQFAATATLSDATVSHCAASGVQATGASVVLDCHRVTADDNVGGATNADGFYCSSSAVMRLYDCSAYGNDRQGVYLDTTAGDGCRIEGRFNANKRAGVSIRCDNGFMPNVWCDDNRQYGVELARDPIGWAIGVVNCNNTGKNLSGLWTTNTAGTGVEVFGASYCRFASIIAQDNDGYGVAITHDTTTLTASKHNTFASIEISDSGDPGLHFSEGASHNHVGYLQVSNSTVACIFGEDGAATTNDYNTVETIVAEVCGYQALRINKGSYNHFGRIIARNCSTADATLKGLVDFSGANTIGNVVAFVDQVDDPGPATTLPVNVVRFDASATLNRVLDGYARSSSGPVALDLNGTNEVVLRSLVNNSTRSISGTTRVRSTFDRRTPTVGAALTLTTGVMWSFLVELFAGDVITDISFRSGSTALGTPTNWWFALYDDQATPALMSQTADQLTGAWGSNAAQTKALLAAQTIARSGNYYVSLMCAGAVMPTISGVTFGSTTISAGIKAGQKSPAVTSGSALTTTAPATIATPTNAAGMAYAELSA